MTLSYALDTAQGFTFTPGSRDSIGSLTTATICGTALDARTPEMFSRLFRRARWWEPVPAGLTLYPKAQLVGVPPGPSRLIAVDPGWRFWRPPPAAVH